MAAEIPISKVITVPPQSLPEALAVADDAFALVFSGLGPLQKLAVKKLLAKLISTDLVKSTRADLLADLAFVADKVALVHNDPVAAQNGWYRKTGGSGAGTWTQFEQLTQAIRTEILAARDIAVAAAGTAQGLSGFRATFAEAIAAFAVGSYFTCAESGAIRMYQRTAGLPGYTDQGDAAAPASTADLVRRVIFVATFADIAAIAAPAGSVIKTLGYAAIGDGGGGQYVDDALSDAALVAAHPRAAKATANARYFRLLPEGGAISVEQTGAVGALPGTDVNERPAIQAAVTYANAMGIGIVTFGRGDYTLYSPVRTSDPTTSYAEDGCPLVLTETATLRGVAPSMTRLHFCNVDGSSFQGTTPGTNFQVVLGKVWRGHGIFIKGKAADPGIAKRPGLRLEGISLQGGTLADGDTSWPANVGTGNGWDITHKGVFVEPDKFTGDVYVAEGCEIIGFRGELIYSSNHQNSKLTMRGTRLGESNGQAVNPAGGEVDCTGLLGYNVAACFEGWGGSPGRFEGSFYNLLSDASSIQGGVYNTSGSGTYYKPQIPTLGPIAGKLPVLTVDLVLESAGRNVAIGSWLHGRIVAIDTILQVSANEISGTFREGVQDSNLEIRSICDKANLAGALALTGGTAAGTKQITRCRYVVTLERTKRAAAAGYLHTDGVVFLAGTSNGEEIDIQVSGQVKRSNGMSGGGTAPLDNYPRFRNCDTQRTTVDVGTSGQNISSSANLVLKGDWMGLYGTNNTNVDLILPTAGVQEGHEVLLDNVQGPANGFTFTLGVAGGSGWIGPRKVVNCTNEARRIKIKYTARMGSGWYEIEELSRPLAGNAVIDVASIAAGAVSAVQSIAVKGVRAGMVATVTPSIDLGDNFGIIDVRADTDLVKFRVQNRDAGAAQDPASATYRATAQYGF